MRRGRSGSRQPGGGDKAARAAAVTAAIATSARRSARKRVSRSANLTCRRSMRAKRGAPSSHVRGTGRDEGAFEAHNRVMALMPTRRNQRPLQRSRPLFVRRRADRHCDAGRNRHARRPLFRGALSGPVVQPYPAHHPQRRGARERQAHRSPRRGSRPARRCAFRR